jgi:short-chain Z-isoprenyl diphosphate synthase
MLRDLAYGLYSRKLRRELSGATLPGHVGLIMDGNRRWARQMGLASPSLGHKYGAEHVEDVLNWCERAGIRLPALAERAFRAVLLRRLLARVP